jgi:hypothetical protein
VDQKAGAHPMGHPASSRPGGLGCLGRRRYAVWGISTLGGFRGMGFRTLACNGFLFLTRLSIRLVSYHRPPR